MFDWQQPLIGDDGEVDNELMDRYMSKIVNPFLKTPESIEFEKTHDTAGWPVQFTLHAVHILKRPLHRLQPKHQEDVLLRSFPERLLTYPDVAADIIEELKLMWRYFDREYAWDHAMACHDALKNSYIDTLNEKLTDPNNFCETKKGILLEGYAERNDTPADDFVTMYVKKSDLGSRSWACQSPANLFTSAMQMLADPPSENRQPMKDLSLKKRTRILTQKLQRKPR